jgi:hypothetical protein
MSDRDQFDAFTERARRVLSLAQEEAQRFQHNYIGTEHLLLGLVGEGEGVAAKVLANLGVELNKVRSAVEFIIGRGDRVVLGEIGLTPRARKVIELAVDEARRLNHHYIGTEHLLLGLVREGEGIAAGVLESLGVNLENVRRQTIQCLSTPGDQSSPVRNTVVSSEVALLLQTSSNDLDRVDNFTEHARKLLSLALEEAQRFQHNYIGTEHLLLGLVSEGEGVGAKVLEGLGVEPNKVRSAVEFIIGRGDRIVLGEIGLTPRSKKVVELAVDEARRLNHHYIGTPHFLLGMVREGEGIAAGVLESLGVNLEKARSNTIQYIVSAQGDQPSPVGETISFNEVALSHQTHLATLLFCHIQTADVALARTSTWLRGAAAAGWPLPLALAHDLGLLLSQPANRLTLVKPTYLPFDEDTSAYLSCLQRMATHPLVRDLSSWSPPLSDTVLSVLLARLVEGLELPQDYRLPGGPDGARFLQVLEQELAHTDPATLWQQIPPDARPSWRSLLTPTALTRLERNLQTFDREELRFLAQYGAPMLGSPDPRALLDLLALTGLPAPARLALSQTLRFLPQVSEGAAHRLGGIQTYPEGGYEGLARQGSLESLLPSENAYPDDHFLHRILNHEALYYGRERPRERRRELAYLVGQLGWGLGGDGQVLVRALLLALGQAMRQRGYEVFYSLAGATLSEPHALERPAEVGRLLYAQERGGVKSEVVLRGVLEQLRVWREDYRRRLVLWVLSEDFDRDDAQEHASLYQALQAEGEQQVWYVRVGPVPAQSHGAEPPPVTARHFGRWQIVESGRLWSNEKAIT